MKNKYNLHVEDWILANSTPATIEDIINARPGPPGLFDDDENDTSIEQPNAKVSDALATE